MPSTQFIEEVTKEEGGPAVVRMPKRKQEDLSMSIGDTTDTRYRQERRKKVRTVT
jgi:hypothetical protein